MKSVFFDRDGVINYLIDRGNMKTAPWTLNEFRFIPGAQTAVEMVRDMGYMTFLVTNQPDVLDGNLDNDIHDVIMSHCRELGFDDMLVAYERGSAWYKPNNGMLETLIKKYDIHRDRSYLIGDRWKDIVAGHKSKLTTFLVGCEYDPPEKYEHVKPDYIVNSALHAACFIEELEND